MLAGAAEAPITPITFGAFDVVNVLSARNDEPEKASRPFDKARRVCDFRRSGDPWF